MKKYKGVKKNTYISEEDPCGISVRASNNKSKGDNKNIDHCKRSLMRK